MKYILYWSYLHAFINITFSNSFQYLMNFHISRFFLNNNVFWSLICKYVYSTINKFFWKIFNLSNIYTTINTNFPNFFHFFFIKFHKSICYMYLFIIAIFFFEIVQVSTLCTQNIFVTSRIVSVFTHIRNITFKMYTIAHSWLCVKHFTRIVLSA